MFGRGCSSCCEWANEQLSLNLHPAPDTKFRHIAVLRSAGLNFFGGPTAYAPAPFVAFWPKSSPSHALFPRTPPR